MLLLVAPLARRFAPVRRSAPPCTRRGLQLAFVAFLVTALNPAALTATAHAQGQAAASALSAIDGAEVRRSAETVRAVAGVPVIDGRIDDDAWSAAPLLDGWQQQRPNPGATPTHNTTARILYDDQAIYVGLRMYDSAPDSIAGQLVRRDYTGYSDWIQVVFDSYNDRRTAFRFAVNPSGAVKDAFHFDDVQEDLGWDAVWEAATATDSLGWTAEFRIPFSQLRFGACGAVGCRWGLQLLRDVARLNERGSWAPMQPDVQGFVSQFGELRGLASLVPPRRLEVMPYTMGRVTQAPGTADNPFWRATATHGAVGADVRYGLTSDFTLTATLNPDFGQVEADPSVVNLSAFEVFFRDQRPFFIEGSDIFRFQGAFPYSVRGGGFGNDQPFYSRRIGRTPQGGVPGDARWRDTPEPASILGAAKISGKTRNGWSLGILNAVTAEERTPFVGADGVRDAQPTEPMSNYAVARVMKDFRAGQSALGGIITASNRRLGGTELGWLRSDAYTAGLDGRHRFGPGGNFEVRAGALGTRITGSTEALLLAQRSPVHFYQRPDADHLDLDPARTSLSGYSLDVKLEKIGGGNWRGGAYGHARSPGLDMNDVGFTRNADWLLSGAWLGYTQFRPSDRFRQWNVNLNQWAGWSYGGERRSTGVNVNGFAEYQTLWRSWFGVDHEFPAWSTDALRGGPRLWGPMYTSGNVGFGSDTRRRLSYGADANGRHEYGTGGASLGGGPFATLRIGGRAELYLSPRLSQNRNQWQYVTAAAGADGQPRYVFGELAQTTASLTARASYAFTPRLTVQYYGQPFVSEGRYTRFLEVNDPASHSFATRFRVLDGDALRYDPARLQWEALQPDGSTNYRFGRPDFDVGQFRSNAVLRWEYRPGSAFFLVWSQARDHSGRDGDLPLATASRRLARAEGTNVFLLKMSYWIGR